LTESADGEGVVAFGEADALVVSEKLGVEVGWRGKIEGALEEDLAGSGFEEVAAADYFGDGGVGIVDDTGELIAGETGIVRIIAKGFTPDEEVAEVFACSEGLRAEVAICEGYRCAVGNSEAVVRGGFQGVRGGVGGAAMAAVDRLVVWIWSCGAVFVGGVHHLGEVFAAASARVDVALLEELVERGTV
jgi:hypothetical protein